ncbi:MAG: exodeoxyribonuclease VII large subunit [Phycisphaerales bacterium]|nr:exodeoxyribonuclease VII large subunit [Phycisphaerales bacterium]MCB9854871.1 exodeoxyribonuclease VII large subunit [Phycisphaerales bacterium]MCB9865007.1 exodeoxyribonuclease VII large subunit [Phycisphaerales bacterium]
MTSSGDRDRPLFDPGRMKASAPKPADSSGGDDAVALSVSRVTAMIRGALTTAFPKTLHVVGELSNVSRPSAGHVYFTLKDSSSELRCVMWRTDATRLKFDMTDGLAVVASGKIDVYEPRGQVQFYVRQLQPRGVGALELAFRQLKEKLAAEGLFDRERKRPLPAFPRTIGVITSATGAAIQDIQNTIERRYPKVRVITKNVRVQGDGAAAEVASAIQEFNRVARRVGGVDVLIVGRGGGSLEDLWAFNEEVVARAIAASEIPIVSAVGHEVDFSIADFVADVRAATPTAAAELVVPVLADVMAGIDGIERRVCRAMQLQIDGMRNRLASVVRSTWFRDPVGAIRRWHQWLDETSGRLRYVLHRAASERRRRIAKVELKLVRSRPVVVLERRRLAVDRLAHRLLWVMREGLVRESRRLALVGSQLQRTSPVHYATSARSRLTTLERRLRRGIATLLAVRSRRVVTVDGRLVAASPAQVLKRGFSITRRLRGRDVIRSPEGLREGDRIVTETADGEFHSRVVDSRQGELFQ